MMQTSPTFLRSTWAGSGSSIDGRTRSVVVSRFPLCCDNLPGTALFCRPHSVFRASRTCFSLSAVALSLYNHVFHLHAGFSCPMNPASTSETLMKVRPGVEISGQSDIGCQRENNEDSFGYWEPDDDQQFLRKGRLAIVADGMGGYEGGQEASHLAVQTVSEFYRDQDGDDPQRLLNESLQTAHERVRQHGFAHPRLRGMGTTCTAIALIGYALRYVHVGDTRLYLVRDGQITQMTRDHSYVGRLVESGVISREEAEKHPQRNILTAALGTSADLIMESPERPE